MKKNILFSIVSVCTLAVYANGTSNEVNNNANTPAIDWVKSEIQKLMSTQSSSGENISEMIDVNIASLEQSSLVVVKGHFTNKNTLQYIITVPGQAKSGKELGWETNVWMLVEKGLDQKWTTISTLRGDIAYDNSLLDVDGDGLQEIKMVNRISCDACQKISYKIYSFQTSSFIYTGESNDAWSNHKIARRKHLYKGEMLYNVLQLQTLDLNNDGVQEVVETWIEFHYNGGRKVSSIEQKKNMVVKTKILQLQNGAYAPMSNN